MAKIEAALETGVKTVIVPKLNKKDVMMDPRYIGKVKLIYASNIRDVLKYALMGGKKDMILSKLSALKVTNLIKEEKNVDAQP